MKRGGGDRSWGMREGEEVFGCQALRVCGRHEKKRDERGNERKGERESKGFDRSVPFAAHIASGPRRNEERKRAHSGYSSVADYQHKQ